jgi:hypothetical protein
VFCGWPLIVCPSLDPLDSALSSAGKFSGTIGHIDGEGDIDVPDFKVTGNSRVVHLASTFQAVIDGTNRDTRLTQVESHFGRTTVVSRGDVKGSPGGHGKTVTLAMNVSQRTMGDDNRNSPRSRPQLRFSCPLRRSPGATFSSFRKE